MSDSVKVILIFYGGFIMSLLIGSGLISLVAKSASLFRRT